MSENTVTAWRSLLAGAHRALRETVAGVETDAWSLPTPCEKWSVAQVLQHAAGDQLAYASAITGGPGPSENPFEPSGQLDGDPLAVLDTALDASAAWAAIADDNPRVPSPLPQGAMPAWLGAGACALDAAVHAWDIAVATGQPSPLTPELAKPLMLVATRIVNHSAHTGPMRRHWTRATAPSPNCWATSGADSPRPPDALSAAHLAPGDDLGARGTPRFTMAFRKTASSGNPLCSLS